MTTYQNWAKNYTYNANKWEEPDTIEQMKEVVKQNNKLRVVGSRHSFNDIADSEETMISLQKFNRVIGLDREHLTVTVEAGIIYSDLSHYLQQNGFALQNMASLPHISVAGACATATHGSGNQNSNLSTSIREMEVISSTDEIVTFSREKNEQEMNGGAAVSLGGLGVIIKLTLDIVPTFDIKQNVYENLAFNELEDNFDNIFSSAYSVSLFTDWKDDTFNYAWLKHAITADTDSTEAASTFYGATLAMEKRHPIPGIGGAEHCTDQLGIAGPWLDRLPHFRMDFTPSNGQELQSEYILDRSHAYQALKAISLIRAEIASLLQISEIRTIAKDNLWMSSCYKQDSVAIHFTWKDDWESVQKVLPKIEEALAPFNARPHWGGKLFTMEPKQVQSLYEKLPDFQKLLQQYDPQGKFRNKFMNDYIFSNQ
ncbi:xylitol oxidase [Gracilibacillus boraciitolerans JCM 21714]|uniref:Xylitol oxidase n=1 Tax=Gracilibacillus boraciitolerans JCM 21714 TaxID=1298598 RepID=W4VHN4_9BACI|nr:FAD-binding protein [Gracilibacillus boraciitolerans]GAE92269.1 xylitol oxidase [Gracilibacillus boraciitolerans JCM 21714]